MLKFTKFFTASLAIFAIIGCNADGNRTNIELVQDMMDQISLKAQDWDPKRGGEGSQLTPPENTVARNQDLEKYYGDYSAMETKLQNPIKGDFSPEVISLGKEKYDIYCAVCHGAGGAGDGLVGEKMPVRPRNLLSNEALKYTDGRIYGAITMGFGTMGGYSTQLYNKKDRWAVVNYVRTLQKIGGK